MAIHRSSLRLLRKLYSLKTLLLVIILYLVFHTLYGERGLINYFTLAKKIEEQRTVLEQLRKERLDLEHKTNLLRSESLDLDLLDEQSRLMLGYAHPEEEVTFVEE